MTPTPARRECSVTTSTERSWEALGPTWVEVDLDALAANFTAIAAYVRRSLPERVRLFADHYGLRRPSGPPKIMVVVKANAYGHGAVEVARAAVEAGADMLGVATLSEALELREAGLTEPILIINPLTPAEAETVVSLDVTPTVTSLAAAEALSNAALASRAAGGVALHISVDTGMSRFGIQPEVAPGFAEAVAALPGLTVEGLYTHFSAGSDHSAASLARMRRQLDRFARAVAEVEARGLEIPLRHAACSSAVVRLPESYLDLVRVGNLFYGFLPPGGAAPDDAPLPSVREAWKMRTRVLEVREVPAGTGVGYGPDVAVWRNTRLATVPVGYADGVGAEIRATTFRPRARLLLLLRALLWRLDRRGLLLGPLACLASQARSRAIFIHEGRPVDLVGRISMQQTVLDVTGLPEVAAGSTVTVRVPRVLASPRLGRLYRRGGQVSFARLPCGLVVPAAGWHLEDLSRRPAAG